MEVFVKKYKNFLMFSFFLIYRAKPKNSQCAVVQGSKQRVFFKWSPTRYASLEHENFGLQVCVKVIND